jgi:AbrB family looped-hinge helix DNA binding protein
MMYAKVSKKGQITIPKTIRKKLGIDKEGGVLFLVEDGEIKLKGTPSGRAEDLAGSLKEYADRYVPLEKIRDEIQGKIADEAAREGPSD